MNTFILHQPKITKLLIIVINLTLAALGLILLQNLLSFATEIKLAHNVLLPPIIQKDTTKTIIDAYTIEDRLKTFDTQMKTKYKRGVTTNVDKGVVHVKMTKYYQGKPVRLNIVEIDSSLNPDLSITPTLASNTLAAKSSITKLAKKQNSLVALNGTYFKPQTGVPLGMLMIDGKIYTGPIYDRVAIGIFEKGFETARVQLKAKLKSKDGEINVDNINQPRMLSSYVLIYTPEWGQYAPPSPKYGVQIAVFDGKLKEISTKQLEIPQDGYVIVGPESKLKTLFKSKKIKLNIETTPEWKNVKHIISGGPYLVKNGNVFVDIKEQRLNAIGGRNPRSAIGYTSDNRLILIAVDGREGSSVGMTLTELAYLMRDLGCISAINLDGGGSTVMYVNGKIVNKPTVKGGIALSNAITLNSQAYTTAKK